MHVFSMRYLIWPYHQFRLFIQFLYDGHGKSILIALGMTSLVFAATGVGGASGKTINVMLRYDDYRPCYISNRNIVDQEVVRIAQRYGISITLGVIPFPKDGQSFVQRTCTDEFKYGTSAAKIEIAQHGYRHDLYRMTKRGIYSEFAGRPESEQLALIRKGKYSLEKAYDTPVVTFIPPWNSYDQSTINSLEALGFKVLSTDARHGYSPRTHTLKTVPVTCELEDLRHAIEMVRKQTQRSEESFFVVCLLHSYDFREADKAGGRLDFAGLERLFEWLGRQPDVETLTLSQAADRNLSFGASDQADLAHANLLRNLLPSFLRPDFGSFEWTLPSNNHLRPYTRLVTIRLVSVIVGVFCFVLFSVTGILYLLKVRDRKAIARGLFCVLISLSIMTLLFVAAKRLNANRIIAAIAASGTIAGCLLQTVIEKVRIRKETTMARVFRLL